MHYESQGKQCEELNNPGLPRYEISSGKTPEKFNKECISYFYFFSEKKLFTPTETGIHHSKVAGDARHTQKDQGLFTWFVIHGKQRRDGNEI